MSTVYKAHQPSLDRWVAVKVLAHPGDPQFVARFEREARSIARLQHPNIVPIHDYGEQDGQVYLVVQYVEGGRTLDDLLGEPMEPAAACELIGHVLGALGYAHERGIVHRDIKPGNVLMPSTSWPMLADFGIAKVLMEEEEGSRLTQQGVVVGTAAYMAPEQAFGTPVDERTDLYSAGVMLYEMVTGEVPFTADSPVATLMKQAYEQPPPARSVRQDLPGEIESILVKALAKEQAERFATAAEMAAAVREALGAVRPDAARPADPLAGAYESGVRAWTAGRWDQAVELLGEVAEKDPGYEDVEALLESARTARGDAPEAVAVPVAAVDAPAEAAQAPADADAEPAVVTTPLPAPGPVTPPLPAVGPVSTPPLPAAAPVAAAPDAAGAGAEAEAETDERSGSEPEPQAATDTAPQAAKDTEPRAQAHPDAGTRRPWGWLGVVVLLAALGLAGPVVMVARNLGRSGPGPQSVSMAGLAFRPDDLAVAKGTKILFVNDDVAPHTVTAESGGAFDSGVISPGGTFNLVVSGSVSYRCTIHPSMRARILIRS